MTRAEHLAWAKERALRYLDEGDLAGALASMGSDLRKHPELERSAAPGLMMIGLFDVAAGDAAAVRRFIDGFA